MKVKGDKRPWSLAPQRYLKVATSKSSKQQGGTRVLLFHENFKMNAT